MIYKNNNYMTGRDEGNYKGFEFKLNGFCGYDIMGISSFQPYAGNNLFNYDCKTIRNKLLSMVRYRINKYLIELKGGLENE